MLNMSPSNNKIYKISLKIKMKDLCIGIDNGAESITVLS